MASATNRFCFPIFEQKITKETKRVTFHRGLVFVTFVSFCKNSKGSTRWYDSVLSVSSCEVVFKLLENSLRP